MLGSGSVLQLMSNERFGLGFGYVNRAYPRRNNGYMKYWNLYKHKFIYFYSLSCYVWCFDYLNFSCYSLWKKMWVSLWSSWAKHVWHIVVFFFIIIMVFIQGMKNNSTNRTPGKQPQSYDNILIWGNSKYQLVLFPVYVCAISRF